ncbi:MAG: toll/interleukin-1 receptor domain-containing protein [Chloroflexi bacterium]|nr:toll/interleukin-1 receptor domain-containing protein [Chloroflexota bacterium]
MSFDKQMLQQITDLLTPLFVNVQERRRLLSQALGIDHPLIGLIDFEGPSSIFLPNMIDRLFRYGKLDDGRPALWALLEYARSYVGKTQKHQIDALRPDFDLPPPPRLDRIFVSYSRQNEMDARRIIGDLRDAGLRVWYDREKIKGGENWRQAIERGIDSADHFLFCLSPSSIRSDYARDELLCAHQKNKPIYVAMLENCPLDMGYQDFEDLKWLLQLHIIDFTQREQYGARLRELIHSLPGYAPPDSYYLEKIEPQNLPNPFRGLEVFTELQASFYAGREDEIQNLVGRLQIPERSHLLCIVGTSGSGKSSLVRAGLVPALRDAFPWWRKLIVTPGQNPVNVLADGLQELLGSATQQDTRQRLRQEINALDDIAADLFSGQPEEAQLLIIIDQFEELFIQSSKEESEHFIALLLRALTKPTSRVQAIITFRADYFGHLSSSSELAHLIESNLVYIADMKVEQLRRCIELPARRALVDYEEGLVEQILEDVRAQPGALPLLEYALTALFERKVERLMTFEAYRQLGGIEGALATHAQEIYMTFNALEKKTLQRILLRLADVNEVTVTRRRVRRSEFAFSDTSDEVVQKILVRLTDAETRLLVATLPLSDSVELNLPSAVESDPLYEVSHEAIFLHWPTLREWIDQERANLRALSQVRASLRRWQTGSHTVSLLADELLLSETAEIEDSLLSRGEKQYLDLSQLRKLVQSSTNDTPDPYKEISYRIEGLAAQGVAPCIIIDSISQKPLSVTAMRRVIPHLQVLASKQEKAGRILLDWGLTADTREIRKEALKLVGDS